jgi:hypothetical protein
MLGRLHGNQGRFFDKLRQEARFDDFIVKFHCATRNIPTEHIRLSQKNIVDPENRYRQTFKIQVELPSDISAKARLGSCAPSSACGVSRSTCSTTWRYRPATLLQATAPHGSAVSTISHCEAALTASSRSTPLRSAAGSGKKPPASAAFANDCR